jgi:chromate transport protein ChrA
VTDPWWLFLVLLRASLLSINAQSTIPLIRRDLLEAGLITDERLVEALTIGRLGTGPGGLYIVAVGFFAMGLVGAFVATLATIIPPLLVIPLAATIRPRLSSPRVNGLLRGLALSASALVVVTSVDILIANSGGIPSVWQGAVLLTAIGVGMSGRYHPIVVILFGAITAIVIEGPA